MRRVPLWIFAGLTLGCSNPRSNECRELERNVVTGGVRGVVAWPGPLDPVALAVTEDDPSPCAGHISGFADSKNVSAVVVIACFSSDPRWEAYNGSYRIELGDPRDRTEMASVEVAGLDRRTKATATLRILEAAGVKAPFPKVASDDFVRRFRIKGFLPGVAEDWTRERDLDIDVQMGVDDLRQRDVRCTELRDDGTAIPG